MGLCVDTIQQSSCFIFADSTRRVCGCVRRPADGAGWTSHDDDDDFHGSVVDDDDDFDNDYAPYPHICNCCSVQHSKPDGHTQQHLTARIQNVSMKHVLS